MKTEVFEEVADFLADRLPAEDVLAFRPSEVARARVEYLLGANSRGEISLSERAELSRFLQIEELLGLMQARAHAKIESSRDSLARP